MRLLTESQLKMAAAWLGLFTPSSTTSWCIAALKSPTVSSNRLILSVDFLEGEEVIPGFALPLAHLFQKLSF